MVTRLQRDLVDLADCVLKIHLIAPIPMSVVTVIVRLADVIDLRSSVETLTVVVGRAM